MGKGMCAASEVLTRPAQGLLAVIWALAGL
jgi:hypothetical protein